MAGRRSKGGEGESGEERWLLPYADMITLLLGLFIVLFAMSSIDAKKFDNVRRSLSQTFNGQVLEQPGDVLDGSSGVLDPTSTSAPPSQAAIQRMQSAQAAAEAQYEKQAQEVDELATESGLGNDVKVTVNQRGIVVSLAGDALFDSGEYQLKPAVVDKLVRLERQLQEFGRTIEIAGHTDGAPIAGGNRRLGMERALSVYDLFLDAGFSDAKMRTTSFGATSPVKAPPKDDPEASIAANRRIEITILAPGADDPRSNTVKLADAAQATNGDRGPGAPRPVDAQLEREFSIIDELAATSKELQ